MISRLTPRERLALLVGAVAVVAALLYAGVVLPYRKSLERLDTRIASRQRQVQEVRALRQQFLELQRRLAETEVRLGKSTGFSLFSFVEGLAVQVAGKEHLVYMRPQPGGVQEGVREEAVEIRLEKVRLDQLVRLLYEVEAAEALMQVKGLRIRTRFDDRTLLDATLTIAAYGRSA